MSGLLTPPYPPSQNALAAAHNPLRPAVKGQWFNGARLELDGYTFTRCRFDNCELGISTPQFRLVDCWVDPNCRIFYRGNTINVIQLFTNSLGLDPKVWGGFIPRRNPDGTISIGG